MRNLVVIEGDTIAGNFQCPHGYSKNERNLIEEAYWFKRGRVVSANIGSVDCEDQNGRAKKGMCAYVIMDNCTTVPEEEIKNLDLHKVKIKKASIAAPADETTGKRIRRKTGIGSAATREEVTGDKPATDSKEVNSKKPIRPKTGVVDSL